MLQLIENGPELPLGVLVALEAGDLVLFCGAGISMRAGLPSFSGLVDQLFARLLLPRSDSDNESIDKEQFDRVLTSLEQRAGSGRFRDEVCKILKPGNGSDLSTHHALVQLATERTGKVKLVTTNFDRLFEIARPEIEQRCIAAPRLPVPKPDKWNAIVHLHGRIDDEEDPEHRNLVLTSADFGIAYLTERWASRFVSELFSRFTILFVGYRVNDPVMRYLVDAMAAERKLDNHIKQTFAFAPISASGRMAEEGKWRAMGIEPLLYDAAGNHRALHETLREWGRIWEDGLKSRLNIVADLAPNNPTTLSKELVSQFLWAIEEPSGVAARRLAEPKSNASLAWIRTFQERGLLTARASAETGPTVSVVGNDHQAVRHQRLNPVQSGLSFWLVENLGHPDVARWAVAAGGILHPDFQSLVRWKLEKASDISPMLRQLWLALSGSVPIGRPDIAFEHIGLQGRISTEGWSPSVRLEVLQALSPRIHVRPPIWLGLSSDNEEDAELRISQILSFECSLTAEFAKELVIGPLRSRSDWPTILADLALDLAGLLRHALDLQAALGGASEDHDRSHFEHPSIEPDGLDHHGHEWTLLIELNREAFDALRQ